LHLALNRKIAYSSPTCIVSIANLLQTLFNLHSLDFALAQQSVHNWRTIIYFSLNSPDNYHEGSLHLEPKTSEGSGAGKKFVYKQRYLRQRNGANILALANWENDV